MDHACTRKLAAGADLYRSGAGIAGAEFGKLRFWHGVQFDLCRPRSGEPAPCTFGPRPKSVTVGLHMAPQSWGDTGDADVAWWAPIAGAESAKLRLSGRGSGPRGRAQGVVGRGDWDARRGERPPPPPRAPASGGCPRRRPPTQPGRRSHRPRVTAAAARTDRHRNHATWGLSLDVRIRSA